jgi:hypothetical protein
MFYALSEKIKDRLPALAMEEDKINTDFGQHIEFLIRHLHPDILPAIQDFQFYLKMIKTISQDFIKKNELIHLKNKDKKSYQTDIKNCIMLYINLHFINLNLMIIEKISLNSFKKIKSITEALQKDVWDTIFSKSYDNTQLLLVELIYEKKLSILPAILAKNSKHQQSVLIGNLNLFLLQTFKSKFYNQAIIEQFIEDAATINRETSFQIKINYKNSITKYLITHKEVNLFIRIINKYPDFLPNAYSAIVEYKTASPRTTDIINHFMSLLEQKDKRLHKKLNKEVNKMLASFYSPLFLFPNGKNALGEEILSCLAKQQPSPCASSITRTLR